MSSYAWRSPTEWFAEAYSTFFLGKLPKAATDALAKAERPAIIVGSAALSSTTLAGDTGPAAGGR